MRAVYAKLIINVAWPNPNHLKELQKVPGIKSPKTKESKISPKSPKKSQKSNNNPKHPKISKIPENIQKIQEVQKIQKIIPKISPKNPIPTPFWEVIFPLSWSTQNTPPLHCQPKNTICLGSAFVGDELEMQNYLGVLAWVRKISGTAKTVLCEVLRIKRVHRMGAKNGTFLANPEFSKFWLSKWCISCFEGQISRNWNWGASGNTPFLWDFSFVRIIEGQISKN